MTSPGAPPGRPASPPPDGPAPAPLATLGEIEEANGYFRDPANLPDLLVAGERSRYAWRHVSNVLRTEVVGREGPVRALAEDLDPAIERLEVRFADGTTRTVGEHFERSTMEALLVLRGGAVAHERYKSMRPIDRHVWFSCSKTIVGTSLLTLAHAGLVDVAEAVPAYVPELAGSVWDSVTVEQTLDMATGLDSTEHEEPDARTNPQRGWYRWAVSVGLFEDATRPPERPFDVLAQMRRVKPGHTAFEYNSINTYVCQAIVQKLTGVSLAEQFGAQIWRPMGAEADGYVAVDRQGLPLGFGFMNSTLRDLGRFGLVFTPSGATVGGRPVVPPSVLAAVHQGLRPEMYQRGNFGRALAQEFDVPGVANRYQWDAVTPDGDQFKAGLGGQGLYVSAPRDTVVAFFSNGTQRDEALGARVARSIAHHPPGG